MKVTAAIMILALGILAFAIHQAMHNRAARIKLSESQTTNQRSTEQGLTLKSSRINSPVLEQILNYGNVKELNSSPLTPDQDLRLRLHSVPQEGRCVQDTHVVCKHHYYLAVSTFQEGLGEAVYDLGEVGEISGVEWLPLKKELTASLRLRVTNYPEHVFDWNKALVKAQKLYEIEVSLDKLSVTSVK